MEKYPTFIYIWVGRLIAVSASRLSFDFVFARCFMIINHDHMIMFHDDITAGYLGFAKTIVKITTRFFFGLE